jgi:hypothetical protein
VPDGDWENPPGCPENAYTTTPLGTAGRRLKNLPPVGQVGPYIVMPQTGYLTRPILFLHTMPQPHNPEWTRKSRDDDKEYFPENLSCLHGHACPGRQGV